MVKIEVISRTKGLKGLSTDELAIGEPTSELIKLISEANRNISIDRLRVTIKDVGSRKVSQIPLDPKISIAESAGIPDDAQEITLYVKDLGPQIAWRTVFLVEYLGPLLIHPVFYHLTSIYSGLDVAHTQTQQLAYVIVLLHFLKRELETVYVHKFSSSTMPLFNIFKNSSHYWILSGFNLAYFIYAPQNPSFKSSWLTKTLFHVNDLPSYLNYTLFFAWLAAEIANFKCHLITSNLRKSDGEGYVIPYGFFFKYVSFPNYFFETLAWFIFAVLTGNWTAYVFLVVAGGQMLIWAIQKHKKYLKLFGDDYKKLKRTSMIPYVI
ncbi:very-long-chain enoyl-CoA reductase [[Candida] railenensis]|uniref:Very-long-chain enoyl-CoA reductase n=1 Tax=[Candida] railenensis TaxID=45579 RepID=A0A9P0VWW8_9ASCO|nr:very-long-chain enoyl-CoA reductase [[Candida] railenensis]